jgi:SAM-dependent methyltransferase
MSKIAYDPVKDSFASIIRNSKRLRRFFYFLLDLFFLRSWHIRRVLKKHASKMNKMGEWYLLDAGSGFGQYDRYLLDTFSKVKIDSVDVKTQYLSDNQHFFEKDIEKGKISFEEADLLTFSSEKLYDFIICIDVLEHIEEDERVIKNLSHTLREGGLFLMHSPSHYSEEDADEDDTFVGEHARTGYSKEDIEKKLMEADMLPLKTHYTYGRWGRLSWILTVKWPMILFTKFGMIAALILIFYYPLVLPFGLLMNCIDLYTKNTKGNGIYAIAKKI